MNEKLLVMIINDMVIFPNNEVRIEYDNNYDKQMFDIFDNIEYNLENIVTISKSIINKILKKYGVENI